MNPRVVGALIVAALAVLVFIPTVTYEFLSWDDYKTLARNPDFNPPPGESVNIGRYWLGPHMDLYAPLTYTVWGALSSQAHTDTPDPDTGVTLNPMTFHAINVIFHVGAALVVLMILRRIFDNEWICVAGAALFAVHPLQVESVAWISGMKDVLGGALGLVALWQYLRYAQGIQSENLEPLSEPPRVIEPVPAPPIAETSATVEAGAAPTEAEPEPIELHLSPIGSYIIGTICFVLAMLAKPQAVAIPLLAIVLDLFVARRRLVDAVKPFVLWLALSIPIILLGWRFQPAEHAYSPLAARPLVALDALAWYVGKVLFPLKLAIDYGRNPSWLLHSAQRFWTWIIPVALALISLATYRKFRWLAIGSLLFALAVLPVLGLVRFDFQIFSTVTDHYVYVAMLGVSIIFAGALAQLNSDVWLRVGAAIVLVLAVLSFRQVRTWADSETMFDHAVAVNPDSVAGNNSLGEIWSGKAEQYRHAAQRALAERNEEIYRRSLDLASEADRISMEHYLVSARIQPNDPMTQFNLGNSMLAQKKFDEAAKYYHNALNDVINSPQPKTDSDKIERQSKIALYYFNLGNVYGILNEPAKAIDNFQKSVETLPTPIAETNWGVALTAEGKKDEAKQHFLRALEMNPNFMRARERLYMLTTQPSTTQSTSEPSTRPSTTSQAPKLATKP